MSAVAIDMDDDDQFWIDRDPEGASSRAGDVAAAVANDLERLFQYQLARARIARRVRDAIAEEEAAVNAAESVEFSMFVDGEEFVFGEAAELEPVWGTAERTAWAAGEAVMLFGPQGLGKTTLAQQLVKGRLGLLVEVLGMPVAPSKSKVLYIAGDRPRQAARAMRRLFRSCTPAERAVLKERLVVWKGPLPGDLVKRPALLREMAEKCGCDTIFIDSIKDVVSKLNDDEHGSAYNKAIQFCMVAGIEVCDLHHPRKADAKDGSRPKALDDVYGSTWLTSGHGSVLALWGKAGDLVVEFSQLKRVNAEVGPFKIEHDHETGTSSIYERFDLLGALIAAPAGLTAVELATRLFDTDAPTANEKSQARRQLQALVRADQAVEHPGVAGGAGGGQAARWTPTANARAAGCRIGRPEADGPAVPPFLGRQGYGRAF